MSLRFSIVFVAASLLSGCASESVDAPPAVAYGDSVCHACGMIISDERFATATIIKGQRGAEALLFDDFNCQANYEAAHPEIAVETRWSHNYTTAEWIRTADAVFLESPELHSPMASHTAAFASESDALSLKSEIGGELTTFDALLQRAIHKQ